MPSIIDLKQLKKEMPPPGGHHGTMAPQNRPPSNQPQQQQKQLHSETGRPQRRYVRKSAFNAASFFSPRKAEPDSNPEKKHVEAYQPDAPAMPHISETNEIPAGTVEKTTSEPEQESVLIPKKMNEAAPNKKKEYPENAEGEHDEEKLPEEYGGFEEIISWSAPEHEQMENAREKIIIAGIIAAGFFAGSLITGNYLLTLIIALSYAILYIHAVKRPAVIRFAITNRGVRAGERIFEFEDLKSFWIFYDPPHHKELSVESKKIVMPRIRIPLADVRPAELRRKLLLFLPEKKHEESLIDMLARRIGF